MEQREASEDFRTRPSDDVILELLEYKTRCEAMASEPLAVVLFFSFCDVPAAAGTGHANVSGLPTVQRWSLSLLQVF